MVIIIRIGKKTETGNNLQIKQAIQGATAIQRFLRSEIVWVVKIISCNVDFTIKYINM
jgi:hypothetical protein